MIEHFANKKELTGDEPLNPEAALNTLRETSLEKMKRREARLLEKASLLGNVSAMNRILDLIHASRKKSNTRCWRRSTPVNVGCVCPR